MQAVRALFRVRAPLVAALGLDALLAELRLAHDTGGPPPSLLLPLPMSLLYTPSVDNSRETAGLDAPGARSAPRACAATPSFDQGVTARRRGERARREHPPPPY